MNITSEQKKRIHALKKRAAMSNEDYRMILRRWFQVESCKELSYAGANTLIQHLQSIVDDLKVVGPGNWGWGKEKYECLGHRQGFATPRELRMLSAMWSDITVARTPKEQDLAFDAWLQKRFHLGGVINIKTEDVGKIKRALEEMKFNYQNKKGASDAGESEIKTA